MKNQDFNCGISANVSAEEAMQTISHVSDWWVKNVTGSAEKVNDEFTVDFGAPACVKFKITEFIPKSKIAWLVTDCFLPFLNDKTEWTDTKVVFEISTENNQTTIYFTHQGIVPQVECYDMCVKGWTQYISGSLRKLLTEGVGQPS